MSAYPKYCHACRLMGWSCPSSTHHGYRSAYILRMYRADIVAHGIIVKQTAALKATLRALGAAPPSALRTRIMHALVPPPLIEVP